MAPPANASIKPRRGLNIETKPRPKSAAIGSTNPVRADIIIASFFEYPTPLNESATARPSGRFWIAIAVAMVIPSLILPDPNPTPVASPSGSCVL